MITTALHSTATALGTLDSIARRVVTRRLDGLSRGEVILSDDSGRETFGEAADLRAELHVHRPRFFREAVLGGSVSVTESYMRGDWECADLTALFRIFARNQTATERLDGGLSRLAALGQRLFHWARANTRAGSRKNIAAHYDLGNDFYRLWLDDTMAYSCAVFAGPETSLQQASKEKFDRVCRKLQLMPADEVLEIGTGWGGFALHAAGNFGCQVTTTTISREQFEFARRRIEDAGLADSVTLLQQDYRDLQGRFDKLVSIEMIEAVGYRYLDRFFEQCGGLLRSDGSLVLQGIIMPDRGYEAYLKSSGFLQRYIFPGGCLPSLGAILASAARTTDLRLVHAEDFAPHYAKTLRLWREAFNARLEKVRSLGYTEEFIRLWNYYLSYCEAAFEERVISVLQLQFDKPDCRRDPLELSRCAAAGA